MAVFSIFVAVAIHPSGLLQINFEVSNWKCINIELQPDIMENSKCFFYDFILYHLSQLRWDREEQPVPLSVIQRAHTWRLTLTDNHSHSYIHHGHCYKYQFICQSMQIILKWKCLKWNHSNTERTLRLILSINFVFCFCQPLHY